MKLASSKGKTTDHRYTVNREACGASRNKYVFRFCGEWQSAHFAKHFAFKAAQQHKDARDAILSGQA